MARRLILDTNILIDIERGELGRIPNFEAELLIPGIVVSEFQLGIELRGGTARARRAGDLLEFVLAQFTVLDYTLHTAKRHALLRAETIRAGQARGLHDLIIAAHAAETGYPVLTRDAAARFGGLSGVQAIEPAEL